MTANQRDKTQLLVEDRKDRKQLVDKIDRRIVALVQENHDITQVEIADKLSISQSAVGIRLAKLKESKLLLEADLINYEQLGMIMCRVDVDAINSQELVRWCKKCPLFVNSASCVGKMATSLFFLGEDIKTFRSIIDEHLRKIEGVKNVEITLIDSWEKPFYLKLDLRYSNQPKPPCGVLPYCRRCPSNPEYDGSIWDNSRTFRELSLEPSIQE